MIDRRYFIGGTRGGKCARCRRISNVLAQDDGPASPAIVATTAGKIRGVQCRWGLRLQGCPLCRHHGGGAGRFQPPAKLKPWSNVREATELGPRSPQLLSLFHGFVPPEVEAMDRDEMMGEDCLVLNVWTPTLERGRKLPVMVWLHGGGFTSGSGGFSYATIDWRAAGQEARCRRRHGELPAHGAGLFCIWRVWAPSATPTAATYGQPRHHCIAGVGAGQHCDLRRRPGQRHDHFWSVRWWGQGQLADGPCPRRAACSSGRSCKVVRP